MFTDKHNLELKNLGITKIQNFLSEDQVKELNLIIKKYSVGKGDKKSYFSNNFFSIFKKIFKLNFLRFVDELKIFNYNKKLNLESIAKNYFKDDVSLVMIDGYYNPISDKPILKWHHDCWRDEKVHPDEYSLKIFIYLTEVGKNNGCMSYIHKSHLICDAIRRGIYEKKLKFGPYRMLEEFRKFITNKENYSVIKNLMENPSIVDEFLESINNLNDNVEHEEDYSAKPGDAIIFNEKGLHRGSSPKKNERVVLRYHFRKKNLN